MRERYRSFFVVDARRFELHLWLASERLGRRRVKIHARKTFGFCELLWDRQSAYTPRVSTLRFEVMGPYNTP